MVGETYCYRFLLAFLDLTVHNVQSTFKQFYHFEVVDQEKHCINLFSHNLRTENKGLCKVREITTRGVTRGGGGPGVPVTPLGRPSFEQTTYNIQVAKTP